MNFPLELSAETKKAIGWLNSLPSERQDYLVKQLFNNPESLSKEDTKNIGQIAHEVRRALLTHDKDEVIDKLTKLDMNETLVINLVEQMTDYMGLYCTSLMESSTSEDG